MSLFTLDLRDARVQRDVRTALCWRYYERIYKAAFPIADEAEDPTIWLPLLMDPSEHPSLILHILLAASDAGIFRAVDPSLFDPSVLVGGIHAEYFPKSVAALITYLCVRPDRRGHGVGSYLTREITEIIGRHGAGAPVPIFAEAEDPDKIADRSAREAARRRLMVLDRLGFWELPIRYRQPALGPTKQPLDNLKFLYFTGGQPRPIRLSTLRAFMREFYEGLGAGAPDEASIFHDLDGEIVQGMPLVAPPAGP